MSSNRMFKSKSLLFLGLLFVLAVVNARQVSASSTTLNLIRKAVLSGHSWNFFLDESTTQGIWQREALDDPSFCQPGKTCQGPVVQIFMGSTCEWSETYGFVQLYEKFDKLGACGPAGQPLLSTRTTCSNSTGFLQHSFFPNDRCFGNSSKDEYIKCGTCMAMPGQVASIFWCNATDAHRLTNPTPLQVDITAPKVPNRNVNCADNSTAPESKRCDPRYSIIRWHSGNNGEPSDQPQCPISTPEDLESGYLLGTSTPNQCYLDGYNTWISIDAKMDRISIYKTAGCTSENLLYHVSLASGCQWDEGTPYGAMYSRAGSLQ